MQRKLEHSTPPCEQAHPLYCDSEMLYQTTDYISPQPKGWWPMEIELRAPAEMYTAADALLKLIEPLGFPTIADYLVSKEQDPALKSALEQMLKAGDMQWAQTHDTE